MSWKLRPRVEVLALLIGAFGIVATIPASALTRSVSIEVLPTQSVAPGGTARYPFVVGTKASVGAVTVSVSGEPPGASTTVASGGNGLYELSVVIPANAPPSLSTIFIRIRSRAAAKSASVYLEVRGASIPAPVVTVPPVQKVTDFALDVPPTVNVAVGGNASVLIGFRIVGSSAPTVALGVSGLPAGVSVNFVPNPTFGNSTLGFTTANDASPGSYVIGIVGFAGGISHTYPMTLTIT